MFERLRRARKGKNITCEKMAEVIGVRTRSGYHKKETGLVPFSLSEAKAIAEFLEIPIDDIFFVEEVSEKETSKASGE